MLVAGWAFRFFSLIHDPEIAKLIGKTIDPKMMDFWCVADFTTYLGKIGLSGGGLAEVTRILSAMERAGLLLRAGWHRQIPIMGQQYVTQGFTSPQSEGNLWLSEVLGAELIIASYNAVTVLLAATDAEDNPGEHWGTGLVLDETHIVTNKHVVMGLMSEAGDIEVHPSTVPPGAELVGRSCQVRAHKTLDRRSNRGAPTGGRAGVLSFAGYYKPSNAKKGAVGVAVTTRVVTYRRTAWSSSAPESVPCRLRLARTLLSQRRSPDCRHGSHCDVTTLDRDVVDRAQAFPRGDAGASRCKRRSAVHTASVSHDQSGTSRLQGATCRARQCSYGF